MWSTSSARSRGDCSAAPFPPDQRGCMVPRALCSLFVNEVGPKGGGAIGRALAHMPRLVQLDLQQWQLEPEGAKPLAAALAAHPRYAGLATPRRPPPAALWR